MKPISLDLLELAARIARKGGFSSRIGHSRLIARVLERHLGPASRVRIDSSRETMESCSVKPSGVAYTNSRKMDLSCDLQIVVPVYNVAHFVEDCLSSVLNQETSFSVEIVVVNDGSTDNSLEIINRFTSDKRLRVISQQNAGLSAARNAALDTICGRYVMFVDSDDVLPPGSVEKLMQVAEAEQCDVVEGAYIFFSENQILSTHPHVHYVGEPRRANLRGFAWGKVIRSALLQHLLFPQGYWYEDTVVSHLLYPQCTRVASIGEIVYNYRSNEAGISRNKNRSAKALDSFWILELMLQEMQRFCIAFDQPALILFLQHVRLSLHRNLHQSHDAMRCVLVNLSELLRQYYPHERSTEPSLIPLERAIRTCDYPAFLLSALLPSH